MSEGMREDRKAGVGGGKSWALFHGDGPSAVAEEQRNRERIFMVAAALFADKGYAGTSVREIVEGANVTKPTLYYYFRNKEELYVKLLDLASERFGELLQASLERQGSMRARLKGLFTDIYELFHHHVDLLRLVNSMIYGPHGATPAYDFTAQSDQLENVIQKILLAGVAEGELKPEEMEAGMLLLIGLLRSIQVLLVIKPVRREITQESIANAIDLVFDGAGGPHIGLQSIQGA